MRTRTWILGTSLVLVVGVIAVGWTLRPRQAALPERVDAVLVFAGDGQRLRRGYELVPTVARVLAVSNPIGGYAEEVPCGQRRPVEVVCVDPRPANTRGEARAFADLAEERGWSSVIAVTTQDHVRRARTLLRQCWDGDLTFVAAGHNRRLSSALPTEVIGLLEAVTLRPACR